MEQMLYTIEELGEATGITPRTIRYYTTEGILPPPEARGRYALYSDEHLLRRKLYVQLKSAFLPLHAIKDQMESVTFEDVVALLNNETPPSLAATGGAELQDSSLAPELQQGEPQDGASLYLSRVLANRRTLNSQRRNVPSSQVSENAVSSKENAQGDDWKRIRLMNGVELFVQQPASTNVQTFIRKIRNAARRYGG